MYLALWPDWQAQSCPPAYVNVKGGKKIHSEVFLGILLFRDFILKMFWAFILSAGGLIHVTRSNFD